MTPGPPRLPGGSGTLAPVCLACAGFLQPVRGAAEPLDLFSFLLS